MLPSTLIRIVVIHVALFATLGNRFRMDSKVKSYPPDISSTATHARHVFATLLLTGSVSVSRERLGYKAKRMRSFEEARSFARALTLSSSREWREWSKSGERPDDIPASPDTAYKLHGWCGYPDWLGYEIAATRMRPFEEARSFARALNLRSQKEWWEWSRSGKRPDDIPARPNRVYKLHGWCGYPDWLGYEDTAPRATRMRPFEEARSFARALNLSSIKEWYEWIKSGERPDGIPTSPYQVYKLHGWIGYPDWLGYEKEEKRMRPFEEARSFARALNLSSQKEWWEWSNSGERPDDIPARPSQVYKRHGWIGYPDWLGYEDIALHATRMRPFEEARSFARALNLSSKKEWREWRKGGERPDDIPSAPDHTYKLNGWIGYPDWLGYEIAKTHMRPFEEARSFARSLNLSSIKEWREWSKSGERPDDIPATPNKVYKLHGWIGYADWLGYAATRIRPFEEARSFVRALNLSSIKEWREWSKSGERPDDIPSAPNQAYKWHGWIGYRDWLGYEKAEKRMRPFEEARSFARALNLSSQKEWWEWSKSGQRPDDIPSAPNKVYKLHGWCGYPDWLGYWRRPPTISC